MVPTIHRPAATSDMMPRRAEACRRKSSGRARGRPRAAAASVGVASVGGRMSFGFCITTRISVRSLEMIRLIARRIRTLSQCDWNTDRTGHNRGTPHLWGAPDVTERDWSLPAPENLVDGAVRQRYDEQIAVRASLDVGGDAKVPAEQQALAFDGGSGVRRRVGR